MTLVPGPIIARLPAAHRARMAAPQPRRELPQDFAAMLAPPDETHEPWPQRPPALADEDPPQREPAEGAELQPQAIAVPQALLAIHVPRQKEAAAASDQPPPQPAAGPPEPPPMAEILEPPPPPQPPAAAAERSAIKLQWVVAAAPEPEADVSQARAAAAPAPQLAETAALAESPPPAGSPAPQASPPQERARGARPPPEERADPPELSAPAPIQTAAAVPQNAPQAAAPIRQLAAALAPAIDHTQGLVKLLAAEPPPPPIVRSLQVGLHPQELGSLRITLRLVDGRLDLTVETETPEAARSLERDRAQLGALLGDAGIATPVAAIEIRAAAPAPLMREPPAHAPTLAADGGASRDFPHQAQPRQPETARQSSTAGAPQHGEPARDGSRPVPRRGVYL